MFVIFIRDSKFGIRKKVSKLLKPDNKTKQQKHNRIVVCSPNKKKTHENTRSRALTQITRIASDANLIVFDMHRTSKLGMVFCQKNYN